MRPRLPLVSCSEVMRGSRSPIRAGRATIYSHPTAAPSQYRGGHLPRLRNAAHDGRSVAALASGGGLPRQLVLGLSGLQPDARRVGGLLAARYDPAGIFLSGWRRAAVLDCQPPGERRNLWQDVRTRGLAIAPADRAWHLFAVDAQSDNQLHVR